MDDKENNQENSNEDIKDVTFEQNFLKDMTRAMLPAYLQHLVSFAEDRADIDNAIDKQKTVEEFDEFIREGKRDEEQAWRSISNVQSPNSVIFYIFNATAKTFSLTTSSWDNGIHPNEKYDLEPWDYLSFILRSEPPRIGTRKFREIKVNHDFSYESGKLAFQFTTSLSVSLFTTGLTPHLKHTVRSIGKEKLKCTSSITRRIPKSPYSYIVVIRVG
ncbi:hypothetical protein [Pseudomonas neuropathica]|uniref:Uncharacterized protein n=1 Tax=Pseudomonas neuropathica TaxID=2730425 RepID=A0ACC7N2I7_9PSED